MAIYAIGDVQGCLDPLKRLLDEIQFDPSSDTLWFAGDLVNKGPDSLGTLRFIKNLGDSAVSVLGNHDLHLLAAGLAKKKPRKYDNFSDVLAADDRDELLEWLRNCPLALYEKKLNTLLVHAGVAPQWTLATTLKCAASVEKALRGDKAQAFLIDVYRRRPKVWNPKDKKTERRRFSANCLTRIRFCRANGALDFDENRPPGNVSKKLVPWFEHPKRKTGDVRIIFGHWSSLGLMLRPNLIALDTGCVWGRTLTAARIDSDRPSPSTIPFSSVGFRSQN